jgi:uncharacterized membrane protein
MLSKARRSFSALSIGIIISLTIVAIAGSLNLWKNYALAMKAYSTEIVNWGTMATQNNPIIAKVPLEECLGSMSNFKKPLAEGAGSLFSLQHYLSLLNIKWTNTNIFSAILIVSIILFVVITSVKRITANHHAVVLSSFVLYMMCEFLTPADRNPYMLIEHFGIIGVLFAVAKHRVIFLAVLGLALNHDLPFRFAYQRETGEAIFILAVYLAIFFQTKQKETLTAHSTV